MTLHDGEVRCDAEPTLLFSDGEWDRDERISDHGAECRSDGE